MQPAVLAACSTSYSPASQLHSYRHQRRCVSSWTAHRLTTQARVAARPSPCTAYAWPQPVHAPHRGLGTRLTRLTPPRARGKDDAGPSLNPVEVVKQEVGLQSNRLQQDVRDRVEDAIELLGNRVTVGDVAAKAGVKVAQADEALKALAYDTLATLEVSSEGDVVYAFKPGFKAALRNKSVLARARPLLQKAAGALGYLVRVSFGTALVSSVVIVWLALLALLSSRDDRDDRRGGHGSAAMNMRLFMNVSDLFLYWDPYYFRTTSERVASGMQLTFVEAIFDFVFGSGDPNATFEERRWKRLGEMIRSKGGVVTAEEIAPFLDPPAPQDGGQAYPDEGFVLPALIKFGGEPIVGEDGALLYRFPSLQRSGVTGRGRGRGRGAFAPQESYDVPLESPWEFTAATAGQLFSVVALGLANLVGVAALSGLLADPRSSYLLAAQGLGFVVGLMPALKAYAASFFIIPSVRWFFNTSRNAAIESRNESRAQAADLLNSSRNNKQLLAKIEEARALGKEEAKVLSRSEMVYATDTDVAEQATKQELDDWDSQLSRRR